MKENMKKKNVGSSRKFWKKSRKKGKKPIYQRQRGKKWYIGGAADIGE